MLANPPAEISWFKGAKLNITENCIDRHLATRGDKTAILFEAAARIGAVISEKDIDIEQALASYGQHLGVAFQLVDDLLDYSSSSEALGKNVGDDLAEGKPTLPLIYAIQQGSQEQAELIKIAIENGGYDHIDDVQAIIQQTGALQYTEKMAQQQAELAIAELDGLPESDTRTLLINIARLSVHRSH